MSLRQPLGWSLVALLAAAACQAPKPPPIPLLSQPPAQTLRVAVPSLPIATDPALAPPNDSGFARIAFEALLKPRPDLSDVQPAGAASYEVSGDGLTYTFHLQPKGAWSDGSAVRARDFLLGWQRVLDPRVNSPVGDLLAGRVGNAGDYGSLDPKKDATRIPGFLDGLGLKAPDDTTFVVTLDHRSADFKWIAAIPALAPARAQGPTAVQGPSNGPFHLVASGKTSLTFDANQHYWAGRPKLDQIVLSLRGDATADLARYGRGEEELTTAAASAGAEVARDPALRAQLVQVPQLGEVWAQFNVHSAPFDNPLLRLALAEAIDRDQLVAGLGNPALPSLGPVPKGLPGSRPNLAAQRFDPAAAAATLASSGVPASALQGIKLLVRDLPADRAVATFIAAQVKAHLGVELNLDVKPSPQVSGALQEGKFQVQAPAGWLADYADEEDFLDLFRTENFGQWSRYSSPGYDNLVARADATADPTMRLQLNAEAQQLLAEDAPVAFLYQPASWDLKQPYVEGVTYTALDDWPGDLFAAEISIAAH